MAKGRKTGGRTKGTPNKVTADMRQAWTDAFEQVRYNGTAKGGVDSLVKWGEDNPTEFYKLAARLIPSEVKHQGDPDQPVQHEHRLMRWGAEEIPL